MAVEVHVAALGLFKVDPRTNRIYQRGNNELTIKESLVFEEEHRLVVDGSIASTAGNPTIREYLEAEAALDFEPVQVFQSFIITKKVT